VPQLNYRFRGQVKPQPRQPLRAQIGVKDDEGVATIRLYDPIDSWGDEWGVSAKEFAAALDEIPHVHEIRLHVNSPGGEVYEGIAILNQLRNHPARTVAVVDSLAASAASFIVCGADELVMAKNAELMIHDAWGLCMGNSADMRTLADQLDKISDNIASVYAEKAGSDVGTFRAAMLAETWYSAQEAVDAGLADGLAEPPKDAPQARFDRSMFRHQSRADSPAPAIPTCRCGPNNGPALPNCEHKVECPENPRNTAPSATGSVQRLVRLAALKHNLTA
jgi:ATP-dependent protease ClpP protease subunit